MNAEYDLPGRFLALHRPVLTTWIETAIPGSTLCLQVADQLSHPAVFMSARAIEARTIELQASELEPGVLLVKPADKHSSRLVDQEEERLTPKPVPEQPKPLAGLSWASMSSVDESPQPGRFIGLPLSDGRMI